MRAVFLTAPKDVQRLGVYEEALAALERLHPGSEIVADRDLFEDAEDWRRRWKEIFDLANFLYVLPREDLTVGLGTFKQLRRVSARGGRCLLLDARDPDGVPPTPRFVATKTGSRLHREGDHDASTENGYGEKTLAMDFSRFALIRRVEPTDGADASFGIGSHPGGQRA